MCYNNISDVKESIEKIPGKAKCSNCGSNLGEMIFQPIQTYECHIEVKFIKHLGFKDEKEIQIPLCRKCFIKVIKIHIDKAQEDGLSFWV